jgi:hypothetical protein
MRTLFFLIHGGFPHFGITYGFLLSTVRELNRSLHYVRRSGKEKIAEHFAAHGPFLTRLRAVQERRAADLSANRQIEP